MQATPKQTNHANILCLLENPASFPSSSIHIVSSKCIHILATFMQNICSNYRYVIISSSFINIL